MIKKIENMDKNALVDLALLRDYTGVLIGVESEEFADVSNFTSEEQLEFWRMWRMIPRVLTEQAEKWEIDIYELIHLSSHAWLRMQSNPRYPILVIRKGSVKYALTMKEEEEGEVRVDLWLLHSIGYSYLESLLVIAAKMCDGNDIKKEWRQIRDVINKMVNMNSKAAPLILTKIKEIIYHKI